MIFLYVCGALFFVLCSLDGVHAMIELDDKSFDKTISTNAASDLWIIDFYAVSENFIYCYLYHTMHL
jgi:hypothetical protein